MKNLNYEKKKKCYMKNSGRTHKLMAENFIHQIIVAQNIV